MHLLARFAIWDHDQTVRSLAGYLEDAVHGCTFGVLYFSLYLLVFLVSVVLLANFWGFISAFSASCLGAALGVPLLLTETTVLPAYDAEVGSANVPLGRASLHERGWYPIRRTEALLHLLKRAETRARPSRG